MIAKTFTSNVFYRVQVFVTEQFDLVCADARVHALGFLRELRKIRGDIGYFFRFVDSLVRSSGSCQIPLLILNRFRTGRGLLRGRMLPPA
jgi:hypothetical protein